MGNYLVSPNPHIHSAVSTRSLMLDVVIALMPAVLVSILVYGWSELAILAVSVASCVLLEWAITKYLLKKPSTISDLSAVVTGLLLAMNLPSTTPWWIVVIGAIVAIGVAKMTFGGLGQNIFNPAITGRVFLLVSFPTYMTDWTASKGFIPVVDAVSGATPLGIVKEALKSNMTITDLMTQHGYTVGGLLHDIGGSAGEISSIALLVGFIYLLVRRVIKPWIPLTILATAAAIAAIFHGINPDVYTGVSFNLLRGGMILGACFMATDYVTSPMSNWGGVIYGFGIGFLVMMIRYFGAYPEGMSFAILIMNMCVPLINRWFHGKKYGRK